MKSKIFNVIALSFLLVLVFSCDRPKCQNENPIFEKNQPNSEIYKSELVKQLKTIDHSKLTYWFQRYEEQDGQEFLYFHIQGDGLCAIIVLSMHHWNKIESVREKKGLGRRGAEFTNLKFDIEQDSLSTNFIYKSYDRLID